MHLLTFTWVYTLPWGFDARYQIIGVGEFEDGVQGIGRINVGESCPLKTWITLKPVWAKLMVEYSENVCGLIFESKG